MDLEEWDWEFLPDGGFLDFHEDGAGTRTCDLKIVFNMDYFTCPSSNSQLDPPNDEQEKEITNMPVEICVMPSTIADLGAMEADLDTVSQIFFKNFNKENDQFVDMKMDSPKSGSSGILPQIDATAFQFDDRHEKEGEVKSGRLKILKWSLNAVGAICSFGVAATLCILVFGTHQTHKHTQKLHLQICTDHKRIKLNEAISAVRGIPLTRAHTTYGGYYDAL